MLVNDNLEQFDEINVAFLVMASDRWSNIWIYILFKMTGDVSSMVNSHDSRGKAWPL